MKNRTTISAHVDQATIERIDQLAKLENRSRSQMTGTAIKLGAELSPEA
jgi:predicted transcriptional regulator